VTNKSRGSPSSVRQSAPTPKITHFKMTHYYNPVYSR